MEKPFLKVNATFPRGKEEVQLSLTVNALPVGNNSMPPIASLCLGTSGCDYPGRIEFGKKHSYNGRDVRCPSERGIWYNSRLMMRGGSWGSSEVMV
jgi:hypothetical protein